MKASTASSVSSANSWPRTRNVWAVLSCLSAALILPLWGFYALSSLTLQNPLEGKAAFNLLSDSALVFIRANSLELGLVVVTFTVAPVALLIATLVSLQANPKASQSPETRIAVVLNAILILLIAVTLPALFTV